MPASAGRQKLPPRRKAGATTIGRNFAITAPGEKAAGQPSRRSARNSSASAEQPDGDGIDMPVTGEGPQDERVPGIDQHPLGAAGAASDSRRSRQQHGDDLAGEHGELHGDHGLADPPDRRRRPTSAAGG